LIALAAAEVVEHGRVRDADVGRDLLQADPGGAGDDEPSLRGVEDLGARLLGRAPLARLGGRGRLLRSGHARNIARREVRDKDADY
jgi:hypothetical protein